MRRLLIHQKDSFNEYESWYNDSRQLVPSGGNYNLKVVAKLFEIRIWKFCHIIPFWRIYNDFCLILSELGPLWSQTQLELERVILSSNSVTVVRLRRRHRRSKARRWAYQIFLWCIRTSHFQASIWAPNRRREDAHKPDRKSKRLLNRTHQYLIILLTCIRATMSELRGTYYGSTT